MASPELKPDAIGVESFPNPCEFLDPFVDEAPAYDGLFSFLARELDDGHEAKVRDFADTMAFDIKDQASYSTLLRSMLEQRYGFVTAVQDVFHPQLDASINYLKYRLALGIMEPAVDTALDRTNPEHTRVRILRTIIATNMVRGFVNDQFQSCPDYTKVAPTSFLESEVHGYLNQYFNEEYQKKSNEGIVDKFLNGGFAMSPVSRESDGYRFFDIKDFSTRLLYRRNGRHGHPPSLPETDELDEILQSQRTHPVTSVAAANQLNGNGHHPVVPRREVDAEAIRRQVVAKVFAGHGIVSSNGGALKNLGNLDQILPGSSLEGRELARAAASSLLNRLEAGGKVSRIAGRRTRLSPEATEETIGRLRDLVNNFSDEWLPVDALFRLCEADYIDRYGEPPTARDFWDLIK